MTPRYLYSFKKVSLLQNVNLWATVFLFLVKRTAADFEGDALKPHDVHHAAILFKELW